MSIQAYVKDVNRFVQIVHLLIDHDFGHILVDTHIIDSLGFWDKILLRLAKDKHPSPHRLVALCQQGGPLFVKLGQFLSMRPDILPKEYTQALSLLQTHVHPLAFSEVKCIIHSHIGKKVRIDSKPLACASIAQVHTGWLGAKRVAFKVMRPQVREQCMKDLEILEGMIHLMETYNPVYKKYKATKILHEFKLMLLDELDFVHEAHNMAVFSHALQKKARVPKVYKATDEVLVMEYIATKPLSTYSQVKKVFGIFAWLLYEKGLYHGDAHPGNLGISTKNEIVLFDFGFTGLLSEQVKTYVFSLFNALQKQDTAEATRLLLEICDAKDVSVTLQQDVQQALRKPSVQQCEEAMRIVANYGLHVPKELVLLTRTMALFDGLIKTYEPSKDVLQLASVWVETLIKDKMRNMSMKSVLFEAGKTILSLPGDVKRVLQKAESGQITLNIHDTDIKHLADAVETSSNKIVLGALIASLIISGAFLMNVGNFSLTPISVIALGLFGMAIVLALFLMKR